MATIGGVTSPDYYRISGALTVTGAVNVGSGIEVRNVGGFPYIDFSNDADADYDARLDLSTDDVLRVQGAALALLAGVSLRGVVSPSQITGDQNDYAPTGYEEASILRLSTDQSRTITGMTAWATVTGTLMLIANVGSFDLVLAHQSTSSTASHRFVCPGGESVTVRAGGTVLVHYDPTGSRWRVLGA